ncbi:hypothetical protein INT44_000200 [Umbelopsis vinacea]|uniref:Uncharacterized protein n=1 Tax=Umbelopsis vinacea TaxID=44442 RepID=A0A8H7PHI5_9FUNG|nr:hypothetical protein INT44_000200 [Umbelopsis vinacea]
MKNERFYIVALKAYLLPKGKPYSLSARPPRPRPPRRPRRWRATPMDVDIPPLDDLMDIDEPFVLEVVCPHGQAENTCLLEAMEICFPSPSSSALCLPLEEAPVGQWVPSQGMDVCPPSPVGFSCAAVATHSCSFVSVARAAAMGTTDQYQTPASPSSRDCTPPKTSREGTALDHEMQLSPVEDPVAPPDDVEDVNRPGGPVLGYVPGSGRCLRPARGFIRWAGGVNLRAVASSRRKLSIYYSNNAYTV